MQHLEQSELEPIDSLVRVQKDHISVIDKAEKEILPQKGEDPLDVVESLIISTRTPKRGSLLARMYGRVRRKDYRNALLTWLLSVAMGKKPSISWDFREEYDYDIPKHLHYPTIGEIFARAAGAPVEWANQGPFPKWLSIRALRQALASATEGELRQVQNDLQVLGEGIGALEKVAGDYRRWKLAAKNASVRSVVPPENIEALEKLAKLAPVGMSAKLYREPLMRAMMTGFLLIVRKSKMRGNLETVLSALHTLSVAVRGDLSHPEN